LTLYDYFKVLIENKRKIIIISSIAFIFSIILAFFIIKPVFLSSGMVKTASTKSSMLGGILSSTGLAELGDFGDLASGSGSSSNELALYENILMSRDNIEETIIKFNILEEENFKFMYDAVKYFRENVIYLSKDKVAGTMVIGVYDVSPEKAKEMADFLISQLNKKNMELNVMNARNNRIFIEERYQIVKQDLRAIEDSLEKFQDMYGIAPDLQIQLAAKGNFELEAELKSEEIKLDILSKILTPDQAEIKMQIEKINAIKNQLNEINENDYEKSKLNLKGSPNVAMNFLRLKRDLEIQNKIMVTLIPMLEQSKIEENRETPTVLIIDKPNIPDKKSKPKRIVIVGILTFGTFIFTYLFFFAKSVLREKYMKNFKINK